MKKRHALAISLLFGVAVVAGSLAAVRTAGVVDSTAAVETVPDATIRAREAKLDTWEQSLQDALNAKTPRLPPIPDVPRANRGSSSGAAQVVYVNAPPVQDGRENDDEHEREDDGGNEAEHEEDD